MQHFVLISPHHCVHSATIQLISLLKQPWPSKEQVRSIFIELLHYVRMYWLSSVHFTFNRLVRFRPYYCGISYIHPEGWINQLFDLWFHPLHSRIIKHKVIWCINHLHISDERVPIFDEGVLIQTYFVDVTSSLTFIPVNSPSDVNVSEVPLLSLIFREMLPLRHSSFT